MGSLVAALIRMTVAIPIIAKSVIHGNNATP